MLLTEKWSEELNDARYAPIGDQAQEQVTAQLLENQENKMLESTNVTGGISQWSPILLSMVRRITPRLLAYDLVGVQPLTMPTGQIFCMKARLANDPAKSANDKTLPETMGVSEVQAGYSGDGTANATVVNSFGGGVAFQRGTGMSTNAAETNPWSAVGVSVEVSNVNTVSRQLRADYSLEVAEDMRSVHGLNVETELANIISNQIVTELNREMVDKLYISAKQGAQFTTTPGTVDLTADVGGRWSAERFRGLMFAIERDANRVAIETMRGKANKLVVSADVAAALNFAGILSYAPAIERMVDLKVNPSGVTYAGTMGNFAVYVDPYAFGDGYLVGYKGNDKEDAGLFYCPYIPLQAVSAVNPDNFQPAIGFRTRYGWAVNPFVGNTPSNTLVAGANPYYRAAIVTNLN